MRYVAACAATTFYATTLPAYRHIFSATLAKDVSARQTLAAEAGKNRAWAHAPRRASAGCLFISYLRAPPSCGSWAREKIFDGVLYTCKLSPWRRVNIEHQMATL